MVQHVPVVIDTISKVRDAGSTLYVHCFTYQCPNSALKAIDLDALVERLGADHGCLHDDLIRHFYCSHCRKAGKPDRNIGFICGTPERYQP